MPPGWYLDPAGPGGLRWWDGYAWATATRPFDGFGFNPRSDLNDEVSAARPASVAVLAGAGLYTLQYLYLVYVFARFFPRMRAFLEQPGGPSGAVVAPNPGSISGYPLLSNLLELGLVVIAVLFVIWLRRAAIVARRAGLPAKRDPLWAVLGFFVPIVNLWFPYQVARDLFPPGHPARSLVKRWWTLWIGLTVMSYPILIATIFSTPVAIVFSLVGGAIVLSCALTARQIIAACGQTHASLLGH